MRVNVEPSDLDVMCDGLMADLKSLDTHGPQTLALLLNGIAIAFVKAGRPDVGAYISRRATYTFATMVKRNG